MSLESLARRAGSSHASLTGEVAFDPDFVTFGSLQERAGRAEFVFESGLATRGEEATLCLVTSASDYWNRVAETKTFRHPLERRRTTEDPRERA